MPQVVAVIQTGESALLGAATKAVEGAQGDILFVGEASRCPAQLEPSQPDQPAIVTLPQLLGSLGAARLQVTQPTSHRASRRHMGLLGVRHVRPAWAAGTMAAHPLSWSGGVATAPGYP